MDNDKTSDENTSSKTSNQRESSITQKSKKLTFMIGDSLIKDVKWLSFNWSIK